MELLLHNVYEQTVLLLALVLIRLLKKSLVIFLYLLTLHFLGFFTLSSCLHYLFLFTLRFFKYFPDSISNNISPKSNLKMSPFLIFFVSILFVKQRFQPTANPLFLFEHFLLSLFKHLDIVLRLAFQLIPLCNEEVTHIHLVVVLSLGQWRLL